MFAILSILDFEAIRIVNEIHTMVSETCQTPNNIYAVNPHLSWQAAQDYPVEKVERKLEKIAQGLPPLDLMIGGIGVFTGPKPVIYFSVARSPIVELYHNKIWKATSGFGNEINHYFSPERWIPHISLFYVNQESLSNLPCVLAKLLSTEFQFQARINQLSLAFDEDGRFGIKSTFEFNQEIT